MYHNKCNALHAIITICQQEITQVHANAEITVVINNQLTYARIALENLERQSFEVKRCKEREKVEVRRAKPAERKDSVGSFADVFSPEEHTDGTYQTKFNLLQAFIAACQQEISQVHVSTEITAAINDQLTFAKFVLENLERQRYLEQKAILTQMQPSVSVQNPHLMNVTLVSDCTQVPALQLIVPSSDIIQPPMQYMQPQPMTRQQPPQHSYYKYNPNHPK